MLRDATAAPFEYRDVVGINNAIVNRNSESAQRILVIIRQPVVLGNMPEGGGESKYEKVSIMGQLPVKVKGIVSAVDHILASGKK